MSKTKEDYLKRFEDLITKFKSFSFSSGMHGSVRQKAEYSQWHSSSLTLIEKIYGQESSLVKKFLSVSEKKLLGNRTASILIGILKSAKEDFELGFAINLQAKISSEIFTDLNLTAKQALQDDHKDFAAIIASVALEDSLKKFAELNDVEVPSKANLTTTINVLKAAKVFGGKDCKRAESFTSLRDDALHAKWNKVDHNEVSDLISFVDHFLRTNF